MWNERRFFMNNKTINELNAVLKGEQMAIQAYERFINEMDGEDLKEKLKNIQMDHKRHSDELAQYIKNNGGQPQYGTGLGGIMAELKAAVEQIGKRTSYDILKEAYDGEDKGIAMAEEVVKGDLDKESSTLVNRILQEDHAHLKELAKLIGKYEELQ